MVFIYSSVDFKFKGNIPEDVLSPHAGTWSEIPSEFEHHVLNLEHDGYKSAECEGLNGTTILELFLSLSCL